MNDTKRDIARIGQRVPLDSNADYGNSPTAEGIAAPAWTMLFMIECEKEGGTAGTKTTQCSFTYRVRWPGDTSEDYLATGLTPARNRFPTGECVTPTGWNVGWAYYDATGDLVLWDANEILNTDESPFADCGAGDDYAKYK